MRAMADDARGVVAGLEDGTFDLVVGDAFGGLSVPWHLTTSEFLADIHRVLGPDGIYVVNVIDGKDLRFARSHAATVAERWPHLTVVAPPRDTRANVNYVLVGSQTPLDDLTIDGDDGRVLTGSEAVDWIGGAGALIDDFAPVDQLIAR